jgi:hypothetical protein
MRAGRLLTRKPADRTSSRNFDFQDENSGLEIAQEFRDCVRARTQPDKERFSRLVLGNGGVVVWAVSGEALF